MRFVKGLDDVAYEDRLSREDRRETSDTKQIAIVTALSALSRL